ncbi:MAG TPA: prepilin-type N-terminal cleavage/methylation domain-containing protein [Candidatus Omnitrophota bacterium]|nr:prepilin-type N-terminal cleavage/methylation domain-containing protein [Candidatus Omnitrophota bacterium]
MKRSAFTLVELIVVIAIIAILAAVIAPNAFKAIEKAKISRAIFDLRTIRTAAYSFYADTGRIPCTKCGGWGQDPGFQKIITAANCWPNEGGCAPECLNVAGWNGPYLEKWPEYSPWARGGGGKYDWESWGPYHGCALAGVVTLEVYGAVPVASLTKVDEVLDDGNLSTGKLYTEGGTPAAPSYVQYIATCF